MKNSKYLIYIFWFILTCGVSLIGYDFWKATKKSHKLLTQTDNLDTLSRVYHEMLVPIGDSAESHFRMARCYKYLHDTVNMRLEMDQEIRWAELGDSIIKKYHYMEILNEYKYPVNQL